MSKTLLKLILEEKMKEEEKLLLTESEEEVTAAGLERGTAAEKSPQRCELVPDMASEMH